MSVSLRPVNPILQVLETTANFNTHMFDVTSHVATKSLVDHFCLIEFMFCCTVMHLYSVINFVSRV